MSAWTALALLGWAAGIACCLYRMRQISLFHYAGGSDEIWRALGQGQYPLHLVAGRSGPRQRDTKSSPPHIPLSKITPELE